MERKFDTAITFTLLTGIVGFVAFVIGFFLGAKLENEGNDRILKEVGIKIVKHSIPATNWWEVVKTNEDVK